jgi:hypothetical protein
MRLAKILKRIYYSSLLRWWFVITSGTMLSSTCPCCGKTGCPVGIGSAAVFGGVVVFSKTWVQRLHVKLFNEESETHETKSTCLIDGDK